MSGVEYKRRFVRKWLVPGRRRTTKYHFKGAPPAMGQATFAVLGAFRKRPASSDYVGWLGRPDSGQCADAWTDLQQIQRSNQSPEVKNLATLKVLKGLKLSNLFGATVTQDLD